MNTKQLYQKFLDCNSIIDIDSRSISKGSIFFAIKGENFDGNKFADEALKKGSKIAVIDSNEINFNKNDNIIKVDDSLKALQNLALYHRKRLKSKILAITGSNGKTTSKELIHSILSTSYKTTSTEGNLNNHIGVPLSLLKIKDDTEFSVIELGANNFGEIDFLTKMAEPDYGYITNFGKAHLEGFKNISGVIRAKTELYNWLIINNKILILNYDDPEQIKFKSSNHFSFGSKLESKYMFEIIESDNVIVKCNNMVYETCLYGDYNFSNVCSAIAIGLEFGIDPKLIREKLKNFSSNNNRSEIIKINNKNVILDAYNANPTSVEFAIKSFIKNKGTKALVLGDMFELGENSEIEHKKIIDIADEFNIDRCIFIGEEFFKLKQDSVKNIFFKTKEDFYEFGDIIREENILIKGSRGMQLEDVLKNNMI
jgi:UDP-N-acetylmuramoyl-tripeptide--D-alanyl-D-alanine ligase|tara:strand:- start:383 stop:1663 length:1281 start_codon:yes stop_codon:yes gene_type:complete